MEIQSLECQSGKLIGHLTSICGGQTLHAYKVAEWMSKFIEILICLIFLDFFRGCLLLPSSNTSKKKKHCFDSSIDSEFLR